LIGRKVTDKSFSLLDELHRPGIELIKIIRGVKQPVFEIAAQPAHVFNDRIDVLGLFLRGIRIVEAQVALSAELARQPEVDGDRLGMADMKIAVRLWRKAGVHASLIFVGLQIIEDDVPNEI